jgi:(1->4)-alpha-D-glucan 1-alpha-D-glucosylmutase
MPRALLATATHDHKRGEDSRARLAVLSEMPDAWEASLRRWTARMAALKPLVEGVPAPDATDEIMLYQTLLGAWPNDLLAHDLAPPAMAALQARVAAWQEKALREAKRHSEWAAPNAAYEAACQDFLAILLDPAHPAGMARELATLAGRLAPRGALNSLAQTVLRLTCPGIPDLYQGSEFWDLSLVDPDNRREVDFAARAAALDAGAAPGALLAHWRDGRIKLAVLARLLALRARLPELFAHGQYQPLAIEGAYPGRALAFLREHHGSRLLVVVSRLAGAAAGTETLPLITPAAWEDTRLILPAGLALGGMEDVLGSMATGSDPLHLGTLLDRLPVAVLLGT